MKMRSRSSMRLRALATTADTSTTADGEDWPTSDTTPKDIKPTKSRRRKSSVKRSRPKLRRKTISAGSSSASSPFEQYAATDTERSEVADSTEHETTDDDTRSPVEASNKVNFSQDSGCDYSSFRRRILLYRRNRFWSNNQHRNVGVTGG